jgi:cytochrome P450
MTSGTNGNSNETHLVSEQLLSGTSIPSFDFDPFSTEFFDAPHEYHRAMRDAGPVAWLAAYGIWAVARHDEVRAVLMDPKTFCSSRGVGIRDYGKEPNWRTPSLVLETDPPEHDRTRLVLSRVLSSQAISSLREKFTEEAEALVEKLLSRQSFDAISDLAEEYPLTVFPDALGMKRDDRRKLLPFAAQSFNSIGPQNELWANAMKEAEPVREWALQQCQLENLAPGGFGSQIYEAVNTGQITRDEAPLLVRSLLSAGVDTTINSIGASIYCLAQYRDQWDKLRDDPTLARAAFEEAVRFESPVQTFFRTCAQDTVFRGIEMKAGDKVVMFLGSANRDPRKWDEPEIYNIARRTTGHVGFGSGVHMCVGQLLAKLEGEILLQVLARRVSSIAITGTPQRLYNNTLRGLTSLPIRITGA